MIAGHYITDNLMEKLDLAPQFSRAANTKDSHRTITH